MRLHVGSQAPVTAFIGRPVFESRNVRRDPVERARRVQGALIRRGFDWSTVRDLVTYARDESQEPH